VKQIKNISFFVFLVAYLIMVTGFISTREKKGKINSLMIRIADSTENRFIHTADIRNMLEQRKYNMYGKPSGMVNLEEIEEALKSKQIISEAEVYITEPGVLHVDVSQKSPFVRINNRMGQGYYLDNRGNVIPLSHNFSPYVVVANGYISEPFRVGQTLNIFNVKHDS
jgi:cell division protein FtsQ